MKRNDVLGEANGEVTAPAAPREKPIRKFTLKIGGLTVEKRCRVDEMVETVRNTAGVIATLNLDGHRFELAPEPVEA